MAKYDWIALEKEYILGDYKSVSSFLKDKKIVNNGTTRKHTSGWKDKKRQKEDNKKTKTIEKVIEKQSTKEAKQIVDIKSVANLLLEKTAMAVTELNKHADMFGNVHNSIIDRGDIKKLTSALKDLSDVLVDKKEGNNDVEDLKPLIEMLRGESK